MTRYTYTVIPRDTAPEAFRAQLEHYRRLEPQKRAQVALEMSEAARELARTGIRARHPDYDDIEVEHALRRLILGDELFRKAWPDRPVLDP